MQRFRLRRLSGVGIGGGFWACPRLGAGSVPSRLAVRSVLRTPSCGRPVRAPHAGQASGYRPPAGASPAYTDAARGELFWRRGRASLGLRGRAIARRQGQALPVRMLRGGSYFGGGEGLAWAWRGGGLLPAGRGKPCPYGCCAGGAISGAGKGWLGRGEGAGYCPPAGASPAYMDAVRGGASAGRGAGYRHLFGLLRI